MTEASLVRRRSGLICDKILRRHRDRLAIVYVRQSTVQQVERHQESTRLQYGLADRAAQYGWGREQIVVIDDDLGRSGASVEGRLGFQRLVAEVGLGNVGLVLGVEMSRLARSCRDWHQLLEICAFFDTLIADADGVYDPSCWRPYSIARCAISRCFRMPDLSAWIPAMVSPVSGNRKRLAQVSRWILIAPLRMERLIQ
jgi:resolvase-like protein